MNNSKRGAGFETERPALREGDPSKVKYVDPNNKRSISHKPKEEKKPVRVELTWEEGDWLKRKTGQKTVVAAIRQLMNELDVGLLGLSIEAERAETEKETRELIKGIYDLLDIRVGGGR